MKLFIGEYGKVILYAMIGASVIGLMLLGLNSWYGATYPSIGESYDMVETYVGDSPIMIVDPIEIGQRNEVEDIDYTVYVSAFSDGGKTEEIEPEVLGKDAVDVTTKGLYKVFFLVTNDSGLSFMKEVPVLVY